jgi:hypothetical protein
VKGVLIRPEHIFEQSPEAVCRRNRLAPAAGNNCYSATVLRIGQVPNSEFGALVALRGIVEGWRRDADETTSAQKLNRESDWSAWDCNYLKRAGLYKLPWFTGKVIFIMLRVGWVSSRLFRRTLIQRMIGSSVSKLALEIIKNPPT